MVGADLIGQILQDCEDHLQESSYASSTSAKLKPSLMDSIRTIKGCLDDISNTNSFMLMTINRCIDYTKASKGLKLIPKNETFNLKEAINMPLMCMKNVQNKVSITLKPIPSDIGQFIITDKMWLQENILCLLSNAAKYSDGGEVTVTVKLRSKDEEEGEDAHSSSSEEITDPGTTISSRKTMVGGISSNSSKVHPHSSRSTNMSNGNSLVTEIHEFHESSVHVEDAALHERPIIHPVGAFYLRVEVEDTGIGVSDRDMEALFSPFKQAQRLAGGTGLGLYSLAKRLDALKGRYGVAKRTDNKQGSLFWFSIPYRPDNTFIGRRSSAFVHLARLGANNAIFGDSHASDLSPTFSRSTAAAEASSEGLKIDTRSSLASTVGHSPRQRSPRNAFGELHVLVADDSPAIVKMTAMMLRRHGHRIEVAENGAIAVRKVEETIRLADGSKERFDLVLMDLQMPVMDGLEAIKRIRALEKSLESNPNCVHQKIIGLSANSDNETTNEAYAVGVDAFMAKPFNLETFEQTLHVLFKPASPNSPSHIIKQGA